MTVEIIQGELNSYRPRSVSFGLFFFEEGPGLTMTLNLNDEQQLHLDLSFTEPYLLAADLEAIGDELKRMAGLKIISDSATTRDAAKQRRREVQEQLRSATHDVVSHCAHCRRGVFLITEDGTRLCKRHADELGLRPKGKIA